MANNKPLRKYLGVEKILKRLTVSATGIWGWFRAQILIYAFRYAAREGVYLIDITGDTITTNMDEATWLKVNGESYAKVEAGVNPEQGAAIDNQFIAAFDNFTVFKKVKT